MRIFCQPTLYGCASRKDAETALDMIKLGCDLEDCSSRGITALHHAAEHNLVDLATAMIDAGANIHCLDRRRYTPLHHAAFNGSLGVAKLLLDRGADIDAVEFRGWTPLMCIWPARYAELVDLFCSHGVDLTVRDNEGRTALALAHRDCRRFEQLLKTGAR